MSKSFEELRGKMSIGLAHNTDVSGASTILPGAMVKWLYLLWVLFLFVIAAILTLVDLALRRK